MSQHASREALANGWADRERAGMSVRGVAEEELGGVDRFESLVPQVVCGLCGCGEAIGSDKAGRMLSCQACRKQYHRKCTKHWAEHRGESCVSFRAILVALLNFDFLFATWVDGLFAPCSPLFSYSIAYIFIYMFYLHTLLRVFLLEEHKCGTCDVWLSDLFNWASWTCGSCRICEVSTQMLLNSRKRFSENAC